MTRLTRWILLPALLLSLAAPLAAQSPEGVIEVRVLPRAEVGGDTYRLGEIAEMDGFDLDALEALAQVEVGRSPLPGRSLALSESLLRSRLAGAIEPERLRLVVPPEATVVRTGRVVTGQEIAEMVLARSLADAPAGEGEVKQHLVGRLPDVTVARGELAWDIQPLGRYLRPGGSRTYQVVLNVDGQPFWRSTARVEQKVYVDVVVARRVIRREQTVQAEDLTVERRPLQTLNGKAYVGAAAPLVGQIARRPIGKGELVTAALVTPQADVAEGSAVLIVYRVPGLSLSAPGVALVAARQGQFIPVRNLQSGKIVYGVVESEQRVSVN